jgi:hypothetical protein
MSVTFYQDSNYRGSYHVLDIYRYGRNSTVTLPSRMFDKASSVRWNLPDGVFVTLMDDINQTYSTIHKCG